jgi:hypothetical protein
MNAIDTATSPTPSIFVPVLVHIGFDAADHIEFEGKIISLVSDLHAQGAEKLIFANITPPTLDSRHLALLTEGRYIHAIQYFLAYIRLPDSLNIPDYIDGAYNSMLAEEIPEKVYIFLKKWYEDNKSQELATIYRCQKAFDTWFTYYRNGMYREKHDAMLCTINNVE